MCVHLDTTGTGIDNTLMKFPNPFKRMAAPAGVRFQMQTNPGQAAQGRQGPASYPVYTGEAGIRRALKLYDSNPYVRRFCNLLQSNVIGKGIVLETEDETLKVIWETYNRGLERPLAEIQREIIINIALFGEVFLLINGGVRFLNPLFFPRYAWQYQGEGYYREGAVVDDNELPKAYYYIPPGENQRLFSVDEVVHCYLRDFPGQYRGQSWFNQAIPRLEALDRLEHTAVTTAELASNIPGFIEIDPELGANPYIYGDPASDEDEVKKQGLPIPQAVKPGDIIPLEAGHKFNQFKVDYPVQAFDVIRMGHLAGAATALGISYAALSGDTTKSNLSSIRYGGIEDIRQYKRWQELVGQCLTQILKRVWQRVTGQDDEAFQALEFKWQYPGYEYFEPVKDVTADKIAVEMKLTSRTTAMSRRGLDFETEMNLLAQEKALMESLGIEDEPEEEEQPNGNDQQPAR